MSWLDETNVTTIQPNLSTPLPPNKYVSRSVHGFIGAFLFLVAVFGIIENSLVIHLFRKEKKLHSLTNNYITALAVSNLLMAIVAAPMASVSSFFGDWAFGYGGCIFHGFTVMFLGLSDLYIITAIAVDRYITIVRPAYRVKMTPRFTKIVILGCFSVAFLWSCFPLMGWNSFAYEGLHTSCSINWMSRDVADIAYIIVLYVLFFCFPVITILTASSLTFKEIKRGLNSEISKKMGKKRFLMEKQIAVTLVFIFVCFLISWLPYACVCLMIVFGNPTNISPLAAAIPAFIAKASVLWNPVIYVGSNRLFRSYFFEYYVQGMFPEMQANNANANNANNDNERASTAVVAASVNPLSPDDVRPPTNHLIIAPARSIRVEVAPVQ